MKISIKPEDNLGEQDSFQKEPPKPFRELTGQEKLSYIWDYYKWLLLAAAILITILSYTIPGMIRNHREAVLYTVFLNTRIKSQEETSLMDDFTKAADIGMKGKRVVLDTSMIINRDKGDTFSMECNQKMLALLSSKTLDVLVCNDENFQFYADKNCFQPLDKILPEEVYKKYEPYMLACDTDQSDKPAYYGISVKTSKVLDDENAFKEEPIFAICANAPQPENAVKFLEYLMKEEIGE